MGKKQLKRLFALVLAVVLFVGYIPTNGIDAKAATKVTVKSIKLNVTQYVLKKGESLKLKATISPTKAKNVKVTWKSSNKKVATVSTKGVVKAKATKGTATITATASGKKATCKITIGKPVTKITASNITVYVGKSKQIKTTLTPKKPTVSTLTFKSSSTKVATVTSKGKVTGKKAGTAKITITAKDRNKIKKVIKVTVKKKTETPTEEQKYDLEKIVLAETSKELLIGDTYKLGVSFVPENTKDTNVKYETSNEAIATVANDGTVTAMGIGTCSITVSNEDGSISAVCTINVKLGMTLDKSEITLKLGETFKPEVTFTPSTIKNKSVKWESTDANIASVISASGVIKALTPGKCTITATSTEDELASASIEVTVSDEGVTKVEAKNLEELNSALSAASAATDKQVITLNTEETNITIPEGTYGNVTLVVKSPNAHIENEATFENIIINEIDSNTWVEKKGNKLFFNAQKGSITVSDDGNPNVYLLNDAESVTVTNNANLQELFVAQAAKVLVKGDSVASKLTCSVIGEGSITTYIPLDIYSTTNYKLVVGPGGEQTAIRADREESVPEVSGIGTLSVTIDSTGTKETIIAENDGGLENLPNATIAGNVLNADMTPAKATVYLVSYSKLINGDNVSVYLNGAKTKKVDTDESGMYTFESMPVGNYVVIVEADGFELITQNVYVPTSYEDSVYNVDDIVLMSTAGQPGSISGTLTDAETGNVITKGLTVILRKGMNNITSNALSTVVSDETGKYVFNELVPGQYTIQLVDDSDENAYVSAFYNISVLSGAESTKNITVSKALNSDEVRFVLTWDGQAENVSADLDISLYGPYAFDDSEYNIYFGEYSKYASGYDMDYKDQSFANLDVDDKEYEGPETITVKSVLPGQYKIFVTDYTNGGNGSMLQSSNPVIKVYVGNTLTETIKMPKKSGGVWYAGNFDGVTRQFSIVNDVYNGKANTTTRANIARLFNQLEQFDIVDPAAFAQYQATLDIVKADYIKQPDSAKLEEYYTQVNEIVTKIKDSLTMNCIKGLGSSESFYSYCGYHRLYSYQGYDEYDISKLTVEFAESAKDAKYLFMPYTDYGDSTSFKLILSNPTMGVSTRYYGSYDKYTESEKWISSINDPDNTGWKTDIYNIIPFAYLGGMNPELGRNLDIKYYDNVELVSAIYKSDVKADEWTYGDNVDAVLKLKNTVTNREVDYKLYYIPLGCEIKNITDTENTLVSVNISYYWYEYDYDSYIYVCGKNDTLGKTWVPVLDEGASYTVEYPDNNEDTSASVIINVSNINGASRKYYLYYNVDTSDAEIIGIYDSSNIYTSYNDYANLYTDSTYFNIEIKGMNSTLGKNLKVFTKPGATAKIEYTDDVGSFDNTSDAKITVTAKSGHVRTYYIIYNKSTEDINVRSISSEKCIIKKAYISYDTLYIVGTTNGVPDDLKITANEGYSCSINEGYISITDSSGSNSKNYYISYSKDNSSTAVNEVKSESEKLAVSIENSISSMELSDGLFTYYKISVIGDLVTCPDDLKITIPEGSTCEVKYAKNDENWPYSNDYYHYSALIVVTDEEGNTSNYLVEYEQDTSKATINSISDEGNTILACSVDSSYTNSIYNNTTGSYEEFYRVYVAGNKSTLSKEFTAICPEGTVIEKLSYATDEDWAYGNKSISSSQYINGTNTYLMYNYVAVVNAKAANGVIKKFMIYYAQDDSAAKIVSVTDENNEYTYSNIGNYLSEVFEYYDGSDYVSEYGYSIAIVGKNKELGKDFKLIGNEGTVVESISYVTDEDWKYSKTEYTYAGIEINEDVYRSVKCNIAARAVVKSADGVRRTYVIYYGADDLDCQITDVTDENNDYVLKEISASDSNFYTKDSKYESVYTIYLMGSKKDLGNTYKLLLGDNAEVVSTTTVGEEAWPYTNETVKHSIKVGEDEYNYSTYTYTDRIVVSTKTGVERIYVIAYAVDESDVTAKDLQDENNEYTEKVDISNESTQIIVFDPETKNSIGKEKVYPITVVGKATTLGNTFKLTASENATIKKISLATDEAFAYDKSNYERKYIYSEEGYTEYSVKCYLSAVVTFTTESGIERTYAIYYGCDNRDCEITEVKDANNTFLSEPIITTSSSNISYYVDDEYVYEDMYGIKIYGYNKDLGDTVEFIRDENTTIAVEKKTDESWKYGDKTVSGSVTVNDSYQKVNFDIVEVITVTNKYGATRKYYVAYATDES